MIAHIGESDEMECTALEEVVSGLNVGGMEAEAPGKGSNLCKDPKAETESTQGGWSVVRGRNERAGIRRDQRREGLLTGGLTETG
jgi:hypothetical protein